MNKIFSIIAPTLLSFSPLLMVSFGGRAQPGEHLIGVIAAFALSLGVLGLFMKIVELEKKVHSLQSK